MAVGVILGQESPVQTVNNVEPDVNGNIAIDASSTKSLPIVGGTMQGSINMNNNKITNLPLPATGAEAANKTYVDNRSFVKKNLSIVSSSWGGYSPASSEEQKLSNAGYKYRSQISVSGLTTEYIPYITLSIPDVINSNVEVANMFLTTSGAFYAYATGRPGNNIAIPTAEFRKENVV